MDSIDHSAEFQAFGFFSYYFCNRKSEMKKFFCHIAISLVFRINNCIAAPSLWAAIFIDAMPENAVRTHNQATSLPAT